MSDIIRLKDASPLVQAVLALDQHYSDLIRLGDRIGSCEMKSNFDFEQTQKNLEHFARAGQGVSEQVIALSQALAEVRAKAEQTAHVVAERAQLVGSRQEDVQRKMAEFAQLGEEVRELNVSMQDLKPGNADEMSEEQKRIIQMRLVEFDSRLEPLIAKARALKEEASASKMKELEQSAESLGQKLHVIRERIATLPAAYN